jgi:hypothetical protein
MSHFPGKPHLPALSENEVPFPKSFLQHKGAEQSDFEPFTNNYIN